MWEERKYSGLLKILLFIVALALAGGFVFYYQKTSEKNKEADALYTELYHEQQNSAVTTSTSVTQESLDAVQAEYEKDLAVVAKYLPGIVCWGDTLTAGTAGGVSFPDVLQDLIDEKICDKYDFRSTIEKAENLTKVKWEDYTVEIPVTNMGVGEESVDTVLGRSGAIPFVTSEEFVIPAACEPVVILFESENGNETLPLGQGDGGVNNVTVDGIEGKLTLDPTSYKSYYRNIYYFTRTEPGAEHTVPQGTAIVTAASGKYLDNIQIICLGTYGGFEKYEELIEKQKALINRQTANNDRYIILGISYLGHLYDGGYKHDFETYENAMTQEFGNHFINIRKYLVSDGLRDANITPTRDDTHEIESGRIPLSLRSSTSEKELNATSYQLIGKVIYDRMDKLGYFDEVKDELGITALEKAEKQAAAKVTPQP